MSVEVENWCLTPLTMGFHPWLFCAVPSGLCRWFVQRNSEGGVSPCQSHRLTLQPHLILA